MRVRVRVSVPAAVLVLFSVLVLVLVCVRLCIDSRCLQTCGGSYSLNGSSTSPSTALSERDIKTQWPQAKAETDTHALMITACGHLI